MVVKDHTFSHILDEVVSRLVRGLQPEKIYLFGSQARGNPPPGSDIDLLVIVPHSDLPRHRREAHSYDLLWGLTTPVDVIVLTHDEFQRASTVKTSLSTTARETGRLIYARPKDN
jgi:predicted nucleotidyltransferase